MMAFTINVNRRYIKAEDKSIKNVMEDIAIFK